MRPDTRLQSMCVAGMPAFLPQWSSMNFAREAETATSQARWLFKNHYPRAGRWLELASFTFDRVGIRYA